MTTSTKPILIIGGGIAGMTAAVEAAEVGYPVILVEREPYLGGRVMRTHRYFPKMCPPTCGFEINVRRIRQNPRIAVHTMATVEEITGIAGSFKASIKVRPRYVTGDLSLDESVCEQITSERDDDFNLGLSKTKALYLPHEMAYPHQYVLDYDALSETERNTIAQTCPPGSIDLNMEEETIDINAGAVIVATGWRPYDATNLDNLGFGTCPDVITNVMMERLAARGGPTAGKIVRPSDGQEPRNVAFVQCAGSRDENHLPYCSAVCCMGSLKQIRYLREQNENATATVFYIDIRTIGRLEKFYYDMLEDENVSFIKGKVAKIEADGANNMVLDVEDTLTGENTHAGFDMVVLATGVVPNTADTKIPYEVNYDDYGFITRTNIDGIYSVGCAQRPCDVSRSTKDATAAVIKAIQCLKGAE